jgi:hypothetical protein
VWRLRTERMIADRRAGETWSIKSPFAKLTILAERPASYVSFDLIADRRASATNGLTLFPIWRKECHFVP